VLAQELVHKERSGGCVVGPAPDWRAVVARDEASVDDEVARRLVPRVQLLAFCARSDDLDVDGGLTAADVAEQFRRHLPGGGPGRLDLAPPLAALHTARQSDRVGHEIAVTISDDTPGAYPAAHVLRCLVPNLHKPVGHPSWRSFAKIGQTSVHQNGAVALILHASLDSNGPDEPIALLLKAGFIRGAANERFILG
jgi:hypothetical protein